MMKSKDIEEGGRGEEKMTVGREQKGMKKKRKGRKWKEEKKKKSKQEKIEQNT